MTDPTALAGFMARIDERTQNIQQSLQRLESGLSDHKSDTDSTFKDIRENDIKPLREKVENQRVALVALALGGGGAAGALVNLLPKLLAP